MFSNTDLGRFLDEQYHREASQRVFVGFPFLECSLLLADLNLQDNPEKRRLLIMALNGVYGDEAQWSFKENPLPHCVIDQINSCAIQESWSIEAQAYLRGILNKPLSFSKNETAAMIYQRQKRIFHRITPSFQSGRDVNLVVCVLGLKSSGKSSVLNHLEKTGHYVIEIYREIDELRRSASPLIWSLPAKPSLWRDEPLRIAISGRGYDTDMPPVLYVGSLLRHAEIQYLNTLGRIVFVHVSASNAVRHKRAFQRGRTIEQDPAGLIELDAHRDGLWPGYETNDVGGLISQATLVIKNESGTSIAQAVDQITNHTTSIQERS